MINIDLTKKDDAISNRDEYLKQHSLGNFLSGVGGGMADLGWGAVSYPVSLAAGGIGRIGATAGSVYKNITEGTPISSKEISSYGDMLSKEVQDIFSAGSSKKESAKMITEPVGKVFDTILKPAKWISDLIPEDYPNAKWITQSASELAIFAAIPKLGEKAKGILDTATSKFKEAKELRSSGKAFEADKAMLEAISELDQSRPSIFRYAEDNGIDLKTELGNLSKTLQDDLGLSEPSPYKSASDIKNISRQWEATTPEVGWKSDYMIRALQGKEAAMNNYPTSEGRGSVDARGITEPYKSSTGMPLLKPGWSEGNIGISPDVISQLKDLKTQPVSGMAENPVVAQRVGEIIGKQDEASLRREMELSDIRAEAGKKAAQTRKENKAKQEAEPKKEPPKTSMNIELKAPADQSYSDMFEGSYDQLMSSVKDEMARFKTKTDRLLDDEFYSEPKTVEEVKSIPEPFDMEKFEAEFKKQESMDALDYVDDTIEVNNLGGKKGFLNDMLDILRNERGSVEIELTENQTKAIARMKQRAMRAGKSLEQFLRDIGTDPEKIPAIIKATEVQSDKPKQTRPTKTEMTNVSGDLGDVTYEMLNSTDELTAAYVRNMRARREIVDTYDFSGRAPERQVPAIDRSEPKMIKEGRDIGSSIGSPNRVFGQVFSFENNPVIDAFESRMSKIKNIYNAKLWKNDILKEVKSAEEVLNETFSPIIEANKTVLEDLAKAKREIIFEQERARKGNADVAADANRKVKAAKERISKIEVKLAPVKEAIRKKNLEMAKDHGDVRVALAVAGELPEGIRLSDVELRAAREIRGYLDRTKPALSELGIPVIEDRPYIPHIDIMQSDLFRPDQAFKMFKKKKGATILSFLEQVDNSGVWYPSIHKILDNYIPKVENKIAMQPFYNRWAKFRELLPHNSKLRNYMERWEAENFGYKEFTKFEQALNAVTSWEYMRLIGGSLSVAFKHVMKQTSSIAQFGAKDINRAYRSTAKAFVDVAKEKLGKDSTIPEVDLYRSFANNRELIRMMDELPIHQGVLDKVKAVLGSPTTAVEALDNGVSIFAALIKGAENSMSHKQIKQAIWKTVLETNFRSGLDQPLWQKKVWLRAATMFQSTPFKLFEWKYDLAKRAFSGEKDIFGTSAGNTAIKLLVTYGIAESIARANNTSVLEMLLHPPYIGHGIGGRWGVTESPLVGLLSDISMNRDKDLSKVAEERLLKWNAITKIRRIAEGKYPTDWYESGFHQLFGLMKPGAGIHNSSGRARRVGRGGRSGR